MNYQLVDVNQKAIIGEGYNNTYNTSINRKESTVELFIEDMKNIKYSFIGEEYYQE